MLKELVTSCDTRLLSMGDMVDQLQSKLDDIEELLADLSKPREATSTAHQYHRSLHIYVHGEMFCGEIGAQLTTTESIQGARMSMRAEIFLGGDAFFTVVARPRGHTHLDHGDISNYFVCLFIHL